MAPCDLIIVAGTPPGALAAYLVQVGEIEAACREPRWGPIYWRGETESGSPVTVKSAGYQDDAWRRVQRDLVRAQLIQAIGRGRGILETGCEVVVLSNEECGMVVSDAGLEGLNAMTNQVLQAIQELSAANANKSILGNCALKSSAIAQRCGIKRRQTQIILAQLERRGLVVKVGERSGWLPVTTL